MHDLPFPRSTFLLVYSPIAPVLPVLRPCVAVRIIKRADKALPDARVHKCVISSHCPLHALCHSCSRGWLQDSIFTKGMRQSDGPRDPDTPSLTTLTVSPEQVAAVPGMSDLIESIRQYVTPDRPENGAGNVAIVFSAIFTALRTGGVTMERNCLALSHFQFGFRGEGYEVSCAT